MRSGGTWGLAHPSIKLTEAAPPFAIFKGWASVKLASDEVDVVQLIN